MFGKNRQFFTNKEEQKIILAIRQAERKTSGEIRVHVQQFLDGDDVLKEAVKTFYRLKMDKTKDRNGVIFFLLPKARQFAVYGDEGIHKKVTDIFWADVKEILIREFKHDHFVEGLVQGIELAGEKLQAYFPFESNDKNELTDDISYD